MEQVQRKQRKSSKALSNSGEVCTEYRGEGLGEGAPNDMKIFDPSLQLLPLFCIKEEKGAH